MRLSQEELSEVLNRAISRQGQAEQYSGDVSSLDEAVEIARQLNIPEEHVLAAAEDLGRTGMRAQKREVIRARRRSALTAGVAVTVGATVLATLAVVALHLPLWLGLAPLALAILWVVSAVRGLSAPVSDAEADRVELPPTPGECRVCGRPAINARATFCDLHQYRAPGSERTG
jgi:hypothetical protein